MVNKWNRKAIEKKGDELKDMQGMKEWKNVIFLVIVYGSCISNNIIVRKIQAVVNSVMKLGAPQNMGNFFTH
jgi:hypothetical protein